MVECLSICVISLLMGKLIHIILSYISKLYLIGTITKNIDERSEDNLFRGTLSFRV